MYLVYTSLSNLINTKRWLQNAWNKLVSPIIYKRKLWHIFVTDSGTSLCTQHILDKTFFEYSFNSPNVAMKPIQEPPCRLLHYQKAETVQCFDNLLRNMMIKQSAGLLDEGDTGEMILTFVGDSRIRQLYAEHLKVQIIIFSVTHNWMFSHK